MNHGTRHGGPVRKCSAIGQLKAFVRLLDLQCVRGRCVRGRQNWRFSGLGRLPSSAETLGGSQARGREVNADSWGYECCTNKGAEQLGLTLGGAATGRSQADIKGRGALCRLQFVATLAIPSDYTGVAGMQALRSIEFGFILVSCNRDETFAANRIHCAVRLVAM